MYKIIIGEFDKERGLKNDPRTFTPRIAYFYDTEEDLIKGIIDIEPEFRPRMLNSWISKEYEPRTFLKGRFIGYRVHVFTEETLFEKFYNKP